jgi:hypothetical protein
VVGVIAGVLPKLGDLSDRSSGPPAIGRQTLSIIVG